jgi:hypothetical protein
MVILNTSKSAVILSTGIAQFNVLYTLCKGGFAASGVASAILLTLTTGKIIRMQQQIKSQNIELLQDIKTDSLDYANSTNPVVLIIRNATEYVKNNTSTPFFRKNLAKIVNDIVSIQKQIENIGIIVEKRFNNGMTYELFITPVKNLLASLIKQSQDLIEKLEIFDEETCAAKAAELKAQGNAADAAEYDTILASYENFVKQIVNNINKTQLKLSQLTPEIAKLSDDELQSAMAIFSELDRVINNTKLYK